ncbi:transcriptional regulator [Leclercia sp. LSNIH6]|nr:transcriptional regulator [Leclercia sp. LSNIH1]AXF65359.1 transcriptional regulator [Leclercia sp. W17]POU73958.1 transcriptional regulator [Leclercia sp. LSNIH6]POU74171.1 transcriptional regulator [Leclercia sp. LSNIH7]POV32912.1 transcriptional regulator [Leclercia sp. LSNIH5]POW54408.1 transcriptional regulator [Leclercia sp. LSNIH8]POW63612.1 transcriptional regulator [Leclercia sp. LSNIH2]HCH38343.1 transcriptional regulator [Enterobacter sp.]
MENQAFRQHNHRFVQRAGSWFKQVKVTRFHFACLSWRQCVRLRVGLAPNVNTIGLRDKTKSLRMRNVI